MKLVTSTGTTFEHEIAVAVETPRPDRRHLLAFTLIGLYVGVIPVALGLLWFPLVFLRLGQNRRRCALALTIGLLVFLFVDAGAEGIEAAGRFARSYQGTALFVGAAVLAYSRSSRSAPGSARGDRVRSRRVRPVAYWRCSSPRASDSTTSAKGLRLERAFALGEAALGTLLVIGFTLHNTTEGLAIIAPIAREPAVTGHARTARIDRRPSDDRWRVGWWVGVFADAGRAVPRFGRRCDRRRWCCRSPDRSIRPDR